MNFGKSFWIKAGIGICIVFVIISFIQSMSKKQPTQTPLFSATPTPVQVPLPFSPKSYVDQQTNVKIYYPDDWTILDNSQTEGVLTRLNFKEDNTDYFMYISHSSSGNETYGQQFDKTDSQDVIYGGRKFQRITYWQNGKPVRIAVIDNDWSQTDVNNFSINLPPTNTQKYIAIFDAIMQNMQFQPSPTPFENQ